MIASCVSEIERLNSLMPFPIDAPISGMRFAPKTSSAIRRMTIISVKPMFGSMVRTPVQKSDLAV